MHTIKYVLCLVITIQCVTLDAMNHNEIIPAMEHNRAVTTGKWLRNGLLLTTAACFTAAYIMDHDEQSRTRQNSLAAGFVCSMFTIAAQQRLCNLKRGIGFNFVGPSQAV
jgi:hypothetical protein